MMTTIVMYFTGENLYNNRLVQKDKAMSDTDGKMTDVVVILYRTFFTICCQF